MRGVITKEIQKIAKKHIGRKITTEELRLIPYIQYVMVNEQRIDISRINEDEKDCKKCRELQSVRIALYWTLDPAGTKG